MNRKLNGFADKLELCGVVLLLFAALRADGGLTFWFPPALTGAAMCLTGLALGWLCSQRGQQFRRSLFSRPAPSMVSPAPQLLIFPKAG